jgi:hypothetical protein
MEEFLFEKCWKDIKQEIEKDSDKAADLFFDWFCRTSSLNNKAKNMISKIDFIFKKLGLDESKYKVSLKNNCPFNGSLYDTFIIDAMDESKRIWISPKLGFSHPDLNGKCELVVIEYGKDGIETKLETKFKDWKGFKSSMKNDNLIEKITKALE